MEFTQQEITLSDGRVLEVGTYGNPDGKTILLHHGTPGSYMTFASYAELFKSNEYFVVSYSRAGYGNSTRNEGRSIASVVSDTTQVLDQLGRTTYLAIGWSGGGPHSLASAALDAPRCVGAICVAGVAPADVDFDWTEGMGPENIEEFRVAKEGGPVYEQHMIEARDSFRAVTPETVVELFGGLLSEADKAAWGDGATSEIEARDLRHAFKVDRYGFQDDDQAFMKAWGFDVKDITVPVAIWYGDEDLMVPPTHGQWLVSNIAGAQEHRFASEGHISIWTNHFPAMSQNIASFL